MRHRKNITFVLMALIMLLVLAFSSGCGNTPPYARHVNISYILNISPKEGEQPKDITLILPIPVENGQPLDGILKAMRRDFINNKYSSTPKSTTITTVQTKYGKMLKIHIPELKHGIDLGGDIDFYSLFNSRATQDRFPLSDLKKTGEKKVMVDPNNSEKMSTYMTHVFVSYKNGTGITIGNRYGLGAYQPGYPDFGGSDGGAFFYGTDKYPFYNESASGAYRFQTDKRGWIEVPAIRMEGL